MNDIVWRPSEDYVERANITRFMRANGISTYDQLVKRSQDDIEWFWDAVVRDLGIEFYEPYERVLDVSGGKPWAKWFVGGRINLAHNCVDRWAEANPERTAVLWEDEEGAVRRVSYAELQAMANRLAGGLQELGVGSGDRVGIFMPMAPETVAATLAARGHLPAHLLGIRGGCRRHPPPGRRGQDTDHRGRDQPAWLGGTDEGGR